MTNEEKIKRIQREFLCDLAQGIAFGLKLNNWSLKKLSEESDVNEYILESIMLIDTRYSYEITVSMIARIFHALGDPKISIGMTDRNEKKLDLESAILAEIDQKIRDKVPVRIVKAGTDNKGSIWAVIHDKDFWLNSFNTKKEAMKFVKEHGLPLIKEKK